MGSGSSKKKATENVVTKVGVINAMTSDTPVTRSESSSTEHKNDVYDFVKARKEEKTENWKEVQKQYQEGTSGNEDEAQERTNPLYDYKQETMTENICPICKTVPMLNVDGFPCRVCGRVFHKRCLPLCGHYTARELLYMDRALTDIGWSCHECDNICNLLTPSEMEDVSSRFEKFDVNKDCSLSAEEYMVFQEQSHLSRTGRPMSADTGRFQQEQFQRLDADNNGSVDYWEFMKHESTLAMAKREPSSLVGLLSAREKQSARRYYETFDRDGDGLILDTEARMVFRSWYGYLERAVKRKPHKNVSPSGMIRPDIENDDLRRHVNHNTDIIMEGDVHKSREMTWANFLAGQALYIISSRPNKAWLNNVQ